MSGRWDADVTPATVLQWAKDLAGIRPYGRCTMIMGDVGHVWVERGVRMTLWYCGGTKAMVLDLDASPEVWLSQIEQALA